MDRRHFMMTSATAVAGIVGSPKLGGAQPIVMSTGGRLDPRRLQGLLDETARSLGIVGAQLAVFDGNTVHEFASGMANRERNLAVTTDTLFQIGSTTKVFNAALVMTLVDEGKLNLDAPITTWIPDFQVADPGAASKITLRQLLSMSSGLDNGSYQDHGRGDDAVERYVAALAKVPLVYEPGTAYGYSNAGSTVAGLAAQRVGGRTWESLLTERVLRPLGLSQSAMFAEDLLFHPVALGYRAGPQGPVRGRNWSLPRSISPAGSTLCCSAGDMVRFARMFMNEGKSADGKQVLSPAAVRTMHTPVATLPAKLIAQRWCCGPYWKEWGGVELFGHSGTATSGSSMLLWSPAKRMAIATIANVPNQGYPLANRIFDAILGEMFGIAKPKLPTPATVKRVAVDPRKYEGRFESLGNRVTITDEAGKLVARTFSGRNEQPNLVSEIVPMGDDRFLPVDPAMGGNRGWDVAFWGNDGGRATHFLNGVFAMRRTG
ncbi:MAG: serine hydrolase domain-containing protein [Gemmatimonadales bacterium]